jgi:hypothetical protein
VVSFTPRSLYPKGKSPWYPLDRKLGGPQSRSGRGGEEKNSHHKLPNPKGQEDGSDFVQTFFFFFCLGQYAVNTAFRRYVCLSDRLCLCTAWT